MWRKGMIDEFMNYGYNYEIEPVRIKTPST